MAKRVIKKTSQANSLSPKEKSHYALQSELRRYGFYIVSLSFFGFIVLAVLPFFTAVPAKCPEQLMPIKIGDWSFSIPGAMMFFGLMLILGLNGILAKRFNR